MKCKDKDTRDIKIRILIYSAIIHCYESERLQYRDMKSYISDILFTKRTTKFCVFTFDRDQTVGNLRSTSLGSA